MLMLTDLKYSDLLLFPCPKLLFCYIMAALFWMGYVMRGALNGDNYPIIQFVMDVELKHS